MYVCQPFAKLIVKCSVFRCGALETLNYKTVTNMKRKTVNICYQKRGTEFYIYEGVSCCAFGYIYDSLFFKILNEEQNKYIDDNKHSQSFRTNILRLSINQFIELVSLIKPNYRNMNYFENATKRVQRLKVQLKNAEHQNQ